MHLEQMNVCIYAVSMYNLCKVAYRAGWMYFCACARALSREIASQEYSHITCVFGVFVIFSTYICTHTCTLLFCCFCCLSCCCFGQCTLGAGAWC